MLGIGRVESAANVVFIERSSITIMELTMVKRAFVVESHFPKVYLYKANSLLILGGVLGNWSFYTQ